MKLSVREIAVFGMLGGVMYASKVLMDVFPNIHLLGVFTMAFTLQYGKKALYPVYIYVLILGLFSGFSAWWVPHLYLWVVLWGATICRGICHPKYGPLYIWQFVRGTDFYMEPCTPRHRRFCLGWIFRG